MNARFAEAVARYEAWIHAGIWKADEAIERMEAEIASLQSSVAAIRKAQKNKKRAAKERKKVVG